MLRSAWSPATPRGSGSSGGWKRGDDEFGGQVRQVGCVVLASAGERPLSSPLLVKRDGGRATVGTAEALDVAAAGRIARLLTPEVGSREMSPFAHRPAPRAGPVSPGWRVTARDAVGPDAEQAAASLASPGCRAWTRPLGVDAPLIDPPVQRGGAVPPLVCWQAPSSFTRSCVAFVRGCVDSLYSIGATMRDTRARGRPCWSPGIAGWSCPASADTPDGTRRQRCLLQRPPAPSLFRVEEPLGGPRGGVRAGHEGRPPARASARPLRRCALQVGDVPAPDLVGPRSDELARTFWSTRMPPHRPAPRPCAAAASPAPEPAATGPCRALA